MQSIEAYEKALALIAAGRTDCGRPLGGRTAQDIARDALFKAGVSWTGGRPTSAYQSMIRSGVSESAGERMLRSGSFDGYK